MPAETWQPPKTGNGLLDQSLVELANRLTGMDFVLASLAVPGVTVAVRSLTLTDQSYVEWRGGAGVVVLPDASFRGKGRGALLTVQNFGTGVVTVRAPARNLVNGLAEITIDPSSGALFSGNGVSQWSALKPGGGHIIQNDGVDFANRKNLNFLPVFTVTDNPGNDATDIDLILPDPGAGFSRFWDPNKWRPGILSPQGASATVTYGVAGTADFIYAFHTTFDRDGTITALGQHIGNNNGKVWLGVYDSLEASPWLPDTRLYDIEKTAVGFNVPVTATGLTIAVTSGRTYWFAAVYNTGGVGGGCINISPATQSNDLWGSDWDGTTGGAPTIARLVGYRHAFTYAQLPSAFPGSGTPTLLKSNGAAAPVTMFKFTPS